MLEDVLFNGKQLIVVHIRIVDYHNSLVVMWSYGNKTPRDKILPQLSEGLAFKSYGKL